MMRLSNLGCRVATTTAKLAMAGAMLLAVAAATPSARAEDITKSFTVNGRAIVRVDTNDGSVRVTSGDNKEVQFHVEYQGYELNKNLRVDTRQDGDKGIGDFPGADTAEICTSKCACLEPAICKFPLVMAR